MFVIVILLWIVLIAGFAPEQIHNIILEFQGHPKHMTTETIPAPRSPYAPPEEAPGQLGEVGLDLHARQRPRSWSC